MDNETLDILRSGVSVELYEALKRQKEIIFSRLVMCAPTHEELLITKGMALQYNSFLSELNKKKKEKE